MKANNIKINQLINPLGLQDNKPTISWNCVDGNFQKGYRYLIRVNSEDKYQSGFIESNRMSFEFPIELNDRDQIEIDLYLKDENDNEELSKTSFEMGIHDWKAKWINPELVIDKKNRQPVSYLKKEFIIDKLGKSRLYITAHGLYEVSINGKRVGDFVLAPGTDDYRKRLQYQIYDVKDLLNEGKNIIEVAIGDGWYRGNNGIDGANHIFGDDLALLCQLDIDNDVVLISDETWYASQDGPIRFSDMEIGEIYDAGKEKINTWHEVKLENFGYGNLVCSDEVIIKEHETFIGERIQVPNGEIVYDFKQNLAGYTYFEVNAKAGDKITIWHGETLDEDGNFTQRNIEPGKRNKNGGIPQKIEYICKDGLNKYKPSFSIFGFKYIKVETDIDLSNAVFKAIAVYSDMEELSKFKCSNEDVNQLFKNTMWSMKSNFVDIPTDCPHRERSGWTGDAAVFVKTGLMLQDSYSVFRKWLVETRLGQKKNGVIANVNPPINKEGGGFSNILDGSTGWADAIVIVPYTMYKIYNDTKILEDNYDAMCRWINYLSNLAKKKKIKNLFKGNPYIIEKGFHWGEWCQPDVDDGQELKNVFTKGAPKSATAYYYYSSKLVAEIAEILNKKEDSLKYKQLSDKIREAYIESFTDDGLVNSDRQCDYVRPLQFDLIDREEENARLLNEMIIKNDYHLNTGFLSTPFLCPILCKYGFVETAYKLLLQDTLPSWLYQIKKGATTIWENWNGLESGGNASLNHYSYGSVSGWLLSGVCGINIEKDQIIIKPYPNKLLEYASGEYHSPLGLIKSSWKYINDEIEFNIEVPANNIAKLVLPNGDEQLLNSGTHIIKYKEL